MEKCKGRTVKEDGADGVSIITIVNPSLNLLQVDDDKLILADSQPESNIFSVRIVSIDYYMSPPLPDMDICYSSFQGGTVNEVPVVRIYGSTPAGQKTCLHIHQALPYLYVPCADILSQPDNGVDAYTHAISLSIEKALKLKGNGASRRQHVHGCSLVRAKKFYGYHASEELFVKIYLYHPQDVSRAASLLLGGAVLDGVLQPHESHIPFLLQFLVDYNLCGMGHVHLSKLKFRPPIPDVVSSVKAKFYRHGKDMEVFSGMSADFQTPSGDLCSNPTVWTSSTLPDGWLWQFSGELKESQDKQKRLSTCELEGDATIDEILNQQSKLYSSLSQTCSDVKMVQSLIPIWEEEYERTGMHGPGIPPPDPGKPFPQDVLRTFSLDLYFDSKLMDLCNEALRPLEKDDKLVLSIKTDKMQNLADHVSFGTARETSKLLMGNNDFFVSQGLSSQKDYCASGRKGKPTLPNVLVDEESLTSDPKALDKEAIGLLRWLVSSQAAEDINSDDEVVCETILSPMLTAMSIDKVLERANMDIESESQQECQDILDSIEDFANFEVRKESSSILYKQKPQASSEKRIPQLYSDDKGITPCVRNTCALLLDTGNKMPLQHQELQHEGKSFPHIHDPKKYSQDYFACASHTKLSKHAIGLVRKRDDSCHGDLSNTVDNNLAEADTPAGCSLRDLMRRKRSYKVEPSECEAHCIKSYSVDDDRKAGTIVQKEENALVSIKQSEDNLLFKGGTERKSLDSFDLSPSLPQKTNVNMPCDPKSAYCSYGKLPLLSRSKKSLWSDTSKDIFFNLYERDDDKLGFGVSAGSVDLPCRCSPEECKEKDDSSLILNSRHHGCTVSTGHLENNHKRENECMATPIITMIDNDTSRKSVASSSFLKCDMEHKAIGDEMSQQTDASGFDILSTCPAHQEILVSEDKSGQNTTSMDSIPDMASDSYDSTDDVTSTAVRIENSGRATEMAMCLTGPSYFMSPTRLMKEKSVELTAMTFCKKPPRAELPDGRSENGLLLRSTRSTYYSTDEGSYDEPPDGGLDELLPFFVDHSRPEMEIQNQLIRGVDSNFHQGAALGVPIHLHNDGSYLYMLTPANTPPSADSICGWLLHDATGVSRTNFDVSVMESSSLKGCSTVLSIEGSRDEACTKLGQNYDYGSNTSPIQDQLKKQSHARQNKNNNIDNNIVKVKALSDYSQDISQISGPDRKLKPTPLSQTGFRDPASVGGGQQLTSVSVEILAESRGDIRPDPRYDAISVIAIAIEDDTNSIPVVYLLLRCNETYQRNLDGISDCTVVVSSEERELFLQFMKIISLFDPDILLGWDIQGGSLGFLAERAAYLGIGLLNKLSRTPSEIGKATRYSEDTEKNIPDNLHPDSAIANPTEDAIIEDEWGRTHGSGVHIGGRIVLNIWRLMRGEIKLNMYTVEAVAEGVLRRKIPSIPDKVLMKWYLSGPGQARYKCVEYMLNRAKLNLEIVNQLDMINRTSELARVFGIDFFSVLSRGSQYRVESMLLRLAHTQNYIAISPGNQQVASQPAMECIPLVMEPESGFYADPVIVLDFQSLYPSMIIAYNLCFSTCLGKVLPSKAGTLGVSSFSPEQVLQDLKTQTMLTPNGVMYVPPKVRKGVLPRLLEEILSTRIMVKQAMKKLSPSQKVLQRIFDSRQLALKLIANVTYGYTAAGFSGRMPCAELADSIVQCGRLTLETAISFVNAHDKWKARVIYGDTDSMFVLLKGRNVKEAFHIGQEIVSEITAMNPVPVTLKLEKVYYPCFLITKKRYVGFSYESPDQIEPLFDAKGIETVRRDTCTAVSKTMEQSLRLFFKHQDILEVKSYLQRQWTRILSGRVSLQDFIFAKEVRLGTYSSRTSSSLPPAAIVATKAMRNDPRAEPRYGERVPYIVIHGEPGARLVDMVVDPFDLLAVESPFRLNELYYINKQIIPALQRVFGLVGADLKKWFVELPRPVREALGKRNYHAINPHRTRIDYYYLSKHCLLCGELVQASARYCSKCSQNKTALATAVIGKTSRLEREIQHLAAICRHCGGGDWLIESGVKCTSLACSVFFERRKVQKELLGLSTVATESGYYPPCMIEWF